MTQKSLGIENFWIRIFFQDVLKPMEINDNWTMATQDTGIKLPKKKVKVEQGPPLKKISMKDDKLSISPGLNDKLCLLKIL